MFTERPKRKKPNSVKTIIELLKLDPFLSENEIMDKAFGYNRCVNWESNKKYADMLRRALDKGKVARVEASVAGSKSKYFYYIPECDQPHSITEHREVWNYIDKFGNKVNFMERKETKQGESQLMKEDDSVHYIVWQCIEVLGDAEIDGETMDFIIEKLGFSDYIQTQIDNKVEKIATQAIDSVLEKEVITLFEEFLTFKGKLPYDQLSKEIDEFLHHKCIKPKPIELTLEELIDIAEEKFGEPVIMVK